MKISELRSFFYTQLASLYEKQEIDAIFFTYIYYKYDISKHRYFLNPEVRCEVQGTRCDLKNLANGCPIQYVLGKTTFYNLEFHVNPSVLIPRPETEELVENILKSTRFLTTFGMTSPSNFEGVAPIYRSRGSLYRILDLCTGSGAIAIALAKNINNAAVWATDNSETALNTAQKNAALNNAEITFLHHDILKDGIANLPDNFDIIVSNPPYIPQSESINMHKNVVDFEPEAALFVPEENPLLFYDAIAHIAKKNLRTGGILYVEIHEKFHFELSEMLAKLDFKEIKLWNDINGKPRFISCKKL